MGKLYGDTVGGRCLKIEGSAEIKICECQTKPKDCSKGVKNDYAATVPRDKSTITNITENHIRLAFEGDVPQKKKKTIMNYLQGCSPNHEDLWNINLHVVQASNGRLLNYQQMKKTSTTWNSCSPATTKQASEKLAQRWKSKM